MPGVIFPESESFVASLAHWLSGETVKPSKGADGEEVVPAPSAFEAECVQMDADKKHAELASKLGTKLVGKLASAKEADARNAFGILLELLVQWSLLTKQAEGLAKELAASPAEASELKSALLLSLYSLVQQHGTLELRFSLLLTLIDFCRASGQLSKALGPVGQRVERVERWVSEWELNAAQQKQLWAMVFDAHTDDDALLYECALKYFALQGAADVGKDAALKERIVKALLITVRSPVLFRCDELSQSAVVKSIAGDAAYAPLHRLLTLMASDTYADFLAFTKDAANTAFMTKNGVPLEACGDKMRMLTLVSLGHANKELAYSAIAEALSVPVDEVEVWVMNAIGNGLITAKMDQVREVVAVSMCAERDFGMKQWERLHTSLVDWRDSIRSLLDVMQKAKPTA